MACGFSLHGFKFIPVIGEYVVAMMEGKLGPELVKLWSGTIDGMNEVHSEVMPHRRFGEGEL
jgi:sarcosine oxidase / L-pipecolate oxidase